MATEIAQAYVQILPSAKGMKSNITSAIGGDVKSAGSSAGESFGSSMVGKLKGVLAAAGIGAIVKQALDAGGDLQQSFGGLDTLYEDAASAAKAYAKEAAAAGISANDYAEQAVSFGASLKQAFGGDTKAAVEAANTAILDMADNSAKMGTDITSIQTAYQGFAKQNYTMLDNLKLGYGGTKTEMQRLLADAEKLSGVKYDLDNLGDVYSAIHVIQENLNLTGVAAEEASTTFTGSFNAMKAAATNLLADLTLGNDITDSFSMLEDSMFAFVENNLLPMVGSLFKQLPDLLSSSLSLAIRSISLVGENAPEIIQIGLDIVMGIASSIIENIPYLIEAAWNIVTAIGNAILETDWIGIANQFISNAKENMSIAAGEIFGTDTFMIDDIIDGLLAGLPGLIESAGTIVTNLLNGILNNLPQIMEGGMQLLLGLIKGIINNLPQIIISINTVCMQIVTTILQNLPQILATGVKIILELVAGLIQAIPKIIAAIPQIVSAIKSNFQNVNWASIGSNIIEGIANGIKDGVGSIISAAQEAAQSAFDAAKEKLKIHSPSRLFRDEIGKMISLGLAEGISENTKPITDAMDDAVSYANNGLQSKITNGIYSGNVNIGGYSDTNNASSGYTQNITINSPTELSPAEIARQTRNATRNMVLQMRTV